MSDYQLGLGKAAFSTTLYMHPTACSSRQEKHKSKCVYEPCFIFSQTYVSFLLRMLQISLGASHLSPPKRASLLKQIRTHVGYVDSVDAIYIHLIKYREGVEVPASDFDSGSSSALTLHAKLTFLLTYGDDFSSPQVRAQVNNGSASLERNRVLYVLPRPRSVSPWSSKATDIANICNLGHLVERIERGIAFIFSTEKDKDLGLTDVQSFQHLLYDRMTQIIDIDSLDEAKILKNYFSPGSPSPLTYVEIMAEAQSTQESSQARLKFLSTNKTLGLGLTEDEIDYLLNAYLGGPQALRRNPTDAEIFMFAQVNSEHCRHKMFNATWTIDNVLKPQSLFQMIRNTEKSIQSRYTISAYSDNAAVFEGYIAPRFQLSPGQNGTYGVIREAMPILVKVETHNHPTAVSPYPGAATGSGGEIRDEGAVGRGSHPKAGLVGFSVSNLLIPGFEQLWETDFGKPAHIASALDIMLEAPIGAANFNNEFGRPALAGYWRTFCERVPTGQNGMDEIRGYHKPIMVAGGLGTVRPKNSKKSPNAVEVGAFVIVLGGPGLLIGLGGGAASSQAGGTSSADLDFASVQRENAEIQRRCQQVIDACLEAEETAGVDNPIQSIHDVGAGGLSNALPELVHDAELGATFEIRDVLVADSSMSPMEIWCNESQERYVLAVSPRPGALELFERIAKRERCPYSIVGRTTSHKELIVTDRLFKQDVIRLPMETLFGKPPKMHRHDRTSDISLPPLQLPFPLSMSNNLDDIVDRILRLPSVGSKSYLITIGDRSITGLVSRDQMVGPWQVPVSDVAVTQTTYGFDCHTGEAMAMGERAPLALLSGRASARMAVAESLTNLASAYVEDISRVKLSANWMCAASRPGEGAKLYESVESIGLDLCPALGIGIPVGKDSMSMSMRWKDGDIQKEITAPLSLIVTAFAPVVDTQLTWTPQLRTDLPDTSLLFFDLAEGNNRLGGSALAQVYKQLGDVPPNVESPAYLKSFFNACSRVKKDHPGVVLAYHDRSDGGLFVTLAEMCIAGRAGVQIDLESLLFEDVLAVLFAEELGAVMQIQTSHVDIVRTYFSNMGFPFRFIYKIGEVISSEKTASLIISSKGSVIFAGSRLDLQRKWAETSYQMQRLRDNPTSADEEYSAIADENGGLFYKLTFKVEPSLTRHMINRPKVAILREQGVNGHIEMAWSFTAAGFDAVDVHMSDIINGSVSLSDFRGLAACGGFSYGDVLGAGNGWSSSVRWNDRAQDEFQSFFDRPDTWGLAVCNGCQFFSRLRSTLSGIESWPYFKANQSGRFESRVSMVEIVDNEVTRKSIFLRDMVGSQIPIAVAHGEGRATFNSEIDLKEAERKGLVAVRYVDAHGLVATQYPANPNGSPSGITGVQTHDGRFLALMPHPERVVQLANNSWYPAGKIEEWRGIGPWFRMFQNARIWCG